MESGLEQGVGSEKAWEQWGTGCVITWQPLLTNLR